MRCGYIFKILWIICIYLLIGIQTAYSQIDDALACFDATRRIEREYNLPPHILSAIALTESGRTNPYQQTQIESPWPWTSNIKGKGYFFTTRQEAYHFLQRQLYQGEESFDVGCMQINWFYHQNAFKNLKSALNPMDNVRYAAEFLKSLYQKTGSWPKAVERYHSATPKHYNRYRRVVADNWLKARDLISPIDGSLYSVLIHERKKSQNLSLARKMNESYKLERMKEIAKLRARVREYAAQEN